MIDKTDFTLVRSRRRTLALTIDNQGRLIARAPLGMGEQAIGDFIRQKRHWIAAKQGEIARSASRYTEVLLCEGETVSYLGRLYVVRHRDVATVHVADGELSVPYQMTLGDFASWLQRRFVTVITKRVKHFACVMGVCYTSVRVSHARRRWGSCGANNTLNFSWRLVLCPPEIIDYVVVHELCHVLQKNHSARFWDAVAAVMPDYRQRKLWLRQNRRLLDVI
ncbi:MAG: M48 family metallopeptidase [Coriobacteriales bacterium]|nr:M48 family metallopeptidase [Coriobacteriales bacterium]